MSRGLALALLPAACLAWAATVSQAAAQTAAPSPGQVTPPTLVPPAPSAPEPIVIPGPGPAEAPPGAERLSVTVGAVEVAGGLPALATDTEALVAPLRGQRVTVAELYGLAARIEAAYAAHGYVLVRVTVPPQHLVDGATVRFVVLDGFIEDVSVEGVPMRVRAVVRARVQPLIGQHGLTLPEIERRLLLAGEVPGVTLKSTLARGSQPGGTRLVLEATYRPISGSLSVDNRLGKEYHRWELAPRLALNSPFGFGELIYGSLFMHPNIGDNFDDDAHRRVGGLGAIIPIGIDGLRINPEVTFATTNPRRDSTGGLRTRGTFDRYAIRALYPLIKTRRESLEVNAAFEVINERQKAPDFDARISNDRLRDFIVGLDWARALGRGATVIAGAVLTHGVDAFGARDRSDARRSGIPLSRAGSEPDFTKIEGSASYLQALPQGWNATLNGRFQVSASGALSSSQQFSLDGPDALSTFPLGRLTGDHGYSVRGELARPLYPTPWFVLAPYLFAAGGEAFLERPTAVEQKVLRAASFGAGVRTSVGNAAPGTLFASLELGRAVSDGRSKDHTRLTFEAGIRF